MKYLNPTRSEQRPERPALVYDDDCGFCLAAARLIQRWAREPVDLVALSEVRESGLLAGIDEYNLYASAHLVTQEGIEFHGAESITRALRLVPGGWAAGVLDLPGLRLLRDAGYRLVDVNRHRISRLLGMEACVVKPKAGSRDELES
jgi:predicted DCC family thiol-disulfide oxidoreductase YuxK